MDEKSKEYILEMFMRFKSCFGNPCLRPEKTGKLLEKIYLAGCHAQAVKDGEAVKWIFKYSGLSKKLLDEILIDMEAAEIK